MTIPLISRTILSISAIGNKYIQDNQPWKLIKGSPADQRHAATVIAVAANLGLLLALLLGPYMPETSSIVLNQVTRAYGERLPSLTLQCRFWK